MGSPSRRPALADPGVVFYNQEQEATAAKAEAHDERNDEPLIRQNVVIERAQSMRLVPGLGLNKIFRFRFVLRPARRWLRFPFVAKHDRNNNCRRNH